jgi:hypothetical protein
MFGNAQRAKLGGVQKVAQIMVAFCPMMHEMFTFLVKAIPMAQTSASFQLLFEERPGYLYVLVRSETITYEIARSYLAKLPRDANRADIPVY